MINIRKGIMVTLTTGGRQVDEFVDSTDPHYLALEAVAIKYHNMKMAEALLKLLEENMKEPERD